MFRAEGLLAIAVILELLELEIRETQAPVEQEILATAATAVVEVAVQVVPLEAFSQGEIPDLQDLQEDNGALV
jgi:hypothetical protein